MLQLPWAGSLRDGVHGPWAACGLGNAQVGGPSPQRDLKRCYLGWQGLLLHLRGCTHTTVLLCPCRVYEYQKIPPLINRIPVKARRTHVEGGRKSSLSPQPGARSSTSSTAGRTKCKCNAAGRKRRLGPCVLVH